MTLREMQEEIIANRTRRGFPSATDLAKTTNGLKEELEEWEEALRENDVEKMIDALADIMVFCLGGIEILRQDAEEVLTNVIMNNKTRQYRRSH